MHRIAVPLGVVLLSATGASAQVVGPLQAQNNLSEIATNGPSAQAAALANLGAVAATGGTLTGGTLAGMTTNLGTISTVGGSMLFGTATYTAGASMPVLSGETSGTLITLTGTLSPSAPTDPGQFVSPYNLIVNNDYISNNTGPPITYLDVFAHFGGSNKEAGGRSGISVELDQLNDPTGQSGDNSYPVFTALNNATVLHMNVGGMSGGGLNSQGGAFGQNAKVVLVGDNGPSTGATYYGGAAGDEIDMQIDAVNQNFVIGGTGTAGDVLTFTFTSAQIAGSPLAVAYTAGTGQTPQSLANNIVNVINNTAALSAIGLSASATQAPGLLGPNVTISWPIEVSIGGTVTPIALTISKAVTGSGSETITAGSVVGGASADVVIGLAVVQINGNESPATTFSSALNIDNQINSVGGNWEYGISFNLSYASWPIARNGTLIATIANNRLSGFGSAIPTPPEIAAAGIDFTSAMFSGAAFTAGGVQLTTPLVASGGTLNSAGILTGGSLNGSGAVLLGNALIAETTAGLAITSQGYIGTGSPTITHAGGGGTNSATGNYFVGDVVYGTESTFAAGCTNGMYQVVTSTPTLGNIGSLDPIVQPTCPGTVTPSGTFALTGGSPGLSANAVITPTWTSDSAILIGAALEAVSLQGAVKFTNGVAMTAGTCGGTGVVHGDANNFSVQIGGTSSATCTLTPGSNYSTKPVCTVQEEQAASGHPYLTLAVGSIVITAPTATTAGVFDVHCFPTA